MCVCDEIDGRQTSHILQTTMIPGTLITTQKCNKNVKHCICANLSFIDKCISSLIICHDLCTHVHANVN